ncbi:MAG: class I SAM-dependent methyltransferase [Terracidiphilus sp.]
MNREEAEAVLWEVKYWHYPFDLPWGTTAPSRPGVDPNRHPLRKKHFFDKLVARYSGSLNRKTVLDLGCCQGYWSFLASRAGAVRCFGIDSSETFVTEAQAIAVVLGINNCEFRCRLLESEPWWGEQPGADVTFMLGILYHLVDPVFVLRKAASLTAETLVVDTEILPGRGSFLGLVPRNPEEPTTRGSNLDSMVRLVPTKAALLSLISDAGFHQIQCLDPDRHMPREYFRGHRISVIAARK